jgi:WhiB family redox-sensing transcriptional regulator
MPGGHDGDVTLKLRSDSITPMPATTREAARRALSRHTRGPEDQALLLDILGLDGPEPHVVHPSERDTTEEGATASLTATAAPDPAPTRTPDPHPATPTTRRASKGRGHRTLPRPLDDEAPDWRTRAACRDQDPELHFPTGTSGPALLQTIEAKRVCGRCPVTEACLRWALETGQDFGIWGSLTEDERRALKRRDARTRARSNS